MASTPLAVERRRRQKTVDGAGLSSCSLAARRHACWRSSFLLQRLDLREHLIGHRVLLQVGVSGWAIGRTAWLALHDACRESIASGHSIVSRRSRRQLSRAVVYPA